MEKIFKVEGMKCGHCSARVEKALSAMGYAVSVSLEDAEVKVSADSVNEKEITEAIEDLGFIVK